MEHGEERVRTGREGRLLRVTTARWRAGRDQRADRAALEARADEQTIQNLRRAVEERRRHRARDRDLQLTQEQLYRAVASLQRALARPRARGGLGRAVRPLAIGALLGVGLSLLYAPGAGAAARAQVRDWAARLAGPSRRSRD